MPERSFGNTSLAKIYFGIITCCDLIQSSLSCIVSCFGLFLFNLSQDNPYRSCWSMASMWYTADKMSEYQWNSSFHLWPFLYSLQTIVYLKLWNLNHEPPIRYFFPSLYFIFQKRLHGLLVFIKWCFHNAIQPMVYYCSRSIYFRQIRIGILLIVSWYARKTS